MKTPYDEFKNSVLWKKVSKSIKALQKNQDITIGTHPDYVIGYIVKTLKKTSKK